MVAEKFKLCENYRSMCDTNGKCFTPKNLQMAKSYVRHKMVELKRHSMKWKHTDSPLKKNIRAHVIYWITPVQSVGIKLFKSIRLFFINKKFKLFSAGFSGLSLLNIRNILCVWRLKKFCWFFQHYLRLDLKFNILVLLGFALLWITIDFFFIHYC